MSRRRCRFPQCRRVSRCADYCAAHVNVRSIDHYRFPIGSKLTLEELLRALDEVSVSIGENPTICFEPKIIQP
jgi:hypothetical protein